VKARPAATLRAVAVSAWTPDVGRAFARVGVHWTICCEPCAEIGTDASDAAEIVRRWNEFPRMLAALQLIAVADSLHRAQAVAVGVLGSPPGVTKSRSSGR
jgi:hypothetical protein